MSKSYFRKKLIEMNAPSRVQISFMDLLDLDKEPDGNFFQEYIYYYYENAYPLSKDLAILMIDLLKEPKYPRKALILNTIIDLLSSGWRHTWFTFDIDYLKFMQGEKIINEKYTDVFNIYTDSNADFKIEYFKKRKEVYFYLEENYEYILKMLYSDDYEENIASILALSFIHEKMIFSKDILISKIKDYSNLNEIKNKKEHETLICYYLLVLSMISLCLKDKDIPDLIMSYTRNKNIIISLFAKKVFIIANHYLPTKESIKWFSLPNIATFYTFDREFSDILHNIESNIIYYFFNEIDLNKSLLPQLYFKVYGTMNNSLLDNKIESRAREITLKAKDYSRFEFGFDLFDIYEMLCYLEVMNHS